MIEDGDELVLQSAGESEWEDLYGFIPQPVPLVDVETSNWFTSTHPRSPFVTGLIVSTQRQDGTRVTLSDWSELALTEQTPAGSTTLPLTHDAIPGLLEVLFGLPGFTLGRDGGVVRGRAQHTGASSAAT